ncbi:hypothetical protein L3Q82_024324 [Scortum barcoo]|uniref:Uncharacterized protein n=1 Tax=Scortum barcoo TaxID=214431 RepID=A0ACB8WYJ3_9TELE|nr:hypothetical protein L3Q82_024324 [Scortum barcoo]
MMRPTTERRSSTLLNGAQTTTNTSKIKEVIVDYRRSRRTEHAPLLIHGEAVERVNNIKFLGIHITSDLTWSMNTAHLVKKAQQRLFFLRKLKHAGLSPQLLTNFYRATIESILCLKCDGMMDKGVLEPVGPALGKEQSFTEQAPLVADDGVQRVAGIVHNIQQFVQSPRLCHRHQRVQLRADHRAGLPDQS